MSEVEHDGGSHPFPIRHVLDIVEYLQQEVERRDDHVPRPLRRGPH